MRGVVILAVALALLSSAWMALDASGRQGGIRTAIPFIAFNMLLAAGLVVWRVAS